MDPTDPAAAPPPTPSPPRAWCCFRCGPASYAVGLDSVAEVVEVERLVRLPHTPPRVLGLCALRRDVVPVVALDRPESGTAGAGPGTLLVLILRHPQGAWGVRIDGEGTVVAEGPLDSAVPDADGSGLTFLGTVRPEETAYAAIDPEASWRELRRGVEVWYRSSPGRDANPTDPTPIAPALAFSPRVPT